MLEGELVLVEIEGETPMGPGDAATFPAGVANGHHLVNRIDPRSPFWWSARGLARALPLSRHRPDVRRRRYRATLYQQSGDAY